MDEYDKPLLKAIGSPELQDLETVQTNAAALSSIYSSSNDPIPVIYQSGYLTIHGYESQFKLYTLGYPNEEVREGFLQFLLPYYSGLSAVRSPFVVSEFCRDVMNGQKIIRIGMSFSRRTRNIAKVVIK